MAIRPARREDVPALTGIYNHYVVHGHATFDDRPATFDEREAWFAQFAASGPHRILVAEDGAVLGWASSQPYRPHPAFARSVETSIYLAPDARGRGLGRRLYAELFALLAAEPVHRAYAGVALPNPASVALHLASGFREVGRFEEYAQKHGVYVSSAWFEKALPGA
ncbi:MAG: N-acetyltransferase family protein [Planctomycetota bacterium]